MDNKMREVFEKIVARFGDQACCSEDYDLFEQALSALASADRGKGQDGSVTDYGSIKQEPKAVLCREIGETSWLEHVPVKPGSARHKYLTQAPEWDTCEVYTHPSPAQDSKVPDGWIAVPRSATQEMIEFAKASMETAGFLSTKNDMRNQDYRRLYHGMISAAPSIAEQRPHQEPTEKMMQAGRDYCADTIGDPVGDKWLAGCFKAMLSAATAKEGEIENLRCNNGQSCEHCEPEHGCKTEPNSAQDSESRLLTELNEENLALTVRIEQLERQLAEQPSREGTPDGIAVMRAALDFLEESAESASDNGYHESASDLDGLRGQLEIHLRDFISDAPSIADKPDHPEQPLAMVADKPQWLPMDTAPYDWTPVQLLIPKEQLPNCFDAEEEGNYSRAIGISSTSETGEIGWLVVGWDWDGETFTNVERNTVDPVAWQPLAPVFTGLQRPEAPETSE